MSKKLKWIIGICIALILLTMIGINAFRVYPYSLISLLSNEPASIHWARNGTTTTGFTQSLTDEEATTVKALLRGYRYEIGGDGAGCPFNDRLALTVGNTKFFLGQDQCQVVMNAQTQQIFQMRDEDWQALAQILAKYGVNI